MEEMTFEYVKEELQKLLDDDSLSEDEFMRRESRLTYDFTRHRIMKIYKVVDPTGELQKSNPSEFLKRVNDYIAERDI